MEEATQYSYKIKAVDASGNLSEASPAVTARTLDDTPPVTTAAVESIQKAGWYVSDVTVTLSAYDKTPPITTVYSMNNGINWMGYTQPVRLTEDGRHTVTYRSTDSAGNVENNQTIPVFIDRTSPTYTLTANGITLANQKTFQDSVKITLELTSEDNLSGVVTEAIMVDGKPYTDGEPLDFAGKLGTHFVKVAIVDQAGNATNESVTFEAATSIASMRKLIERYVAYGDLKEPLIGQLTNRLDQSQSHSDKGQQEQAAKHMEDFLKQLENKSMQEHISETAKSVLRADADYLIKRGLFE